MLKQFNLLLLLSFTVACTLPLAVVQAGEDKLQNDEWQVISLYPPQGVYQAEILQQLVTAVEGLWQVQSSEGTPLLRSIDSLASMNVIVAQQDELRFRRRSEEHTSELQSRPHLVCRLLLEKKKKKTITSN